MPSIRRATVVPFLVLASAVPCPSAGAVDQITLPSVIGDHMVLQRDMDSPIWGWCAVGAEVSVNATWLDRPRTARANEDGLWRVDLPTRAAGGPHEVTVTCGDATTTLTDVMIGEVWICSGQSNMEWRLAQAMNGDEEVAAADHPGLRLFMVPNRQSGAPEVDCAAAWVACTPDTAARFSAVGYFFGRELQRALDVPIGLVSADWGGTVIEAWMSAGAVRAFPEFNAALDDVQAATDSSTVNPNAPTALFNGLVAPIIPLGMRGVIWYQGESNRGRPVQYRALFPAMIADWRAQWGRSFPFYYVQIAPYDYGNDTGQAALLREAQLRTLSVPDTGMVVTTDIGNPADIHPRNKQEVGRRLSLWALARTYGRTSVECSGPLYRDMRVTGDRVTLAFTHATDLRLAPSDRTHFVVAGTDRVFHPATARVDGETVVVTSVDVLEPVAVRYGWEAASEPNLFNGDGLPASPFRTDDWD